MLVVGLTPNTRVQLAVPCAKERFFNTTFPTVMLGMIYVVPLFVKVNCDWELPVGVVTMAENMSGLAHVELIWIISVTVELTMNNVLEFSSPMSDCPKIMLSGAVMFAPTKTVSTTVAATAMPAKSRNAAMLDGIDLLM